VHVLRRLLSIVESCAVTVTVTSRQDRALRTHAASPRNLVFLTIKSGSKASCAFIMSSIPSIAIIGAGLGGLTLARVLQLEAKNAIKVTIYERDTGPKYRPDQGGTLDMHGDSGQKALRLAGLYKQFRELSSAERDYMKIVGKDGVVHFDDADYPSPPADNEGGPGDRPEIDRPDLRKLLLDSVLPGTILWGHNLKSVVPENDGRYRLVFIRQSDSEEVNVTPDFVVGADGAWSRVRSILSDAKPIYSGVSFIETHLDDVAKSHPKLAATIGPGSMQALSDNKMIGSQFNSGDRVRVYLGLRVPEDWLKEKSGIPFDQPAVARERLLELYKDWSSDITDLIRLSKDLFIPRPLFVLPAGHSWISRPGITIIGDAAHLMSPFAGEGANLAMLDGAELAQTLAKFVGDKTPWSVEEFEKTMATRAEGEASKSERNLNLFISDEAPQKPAAHMKKLMAMVMSGEWPPQAQ